MKTFYFYSKASDRVIEIGENAKVGTTINVYGEKGVTALTYYSLSYSKYSPTIYQITRAQFRQFKKDLIPPVKRKWFQRLT